jgi:glycosyltransferase 2 family protein
MARLKKPALLFGISLVLIYLVIRKVGLNELLLTLQQANPIWIILSLLLEPFLVLASVVRWKILIKSQGYTVSMGRLNGLYLIGKFFNNFLPSNVGGDVVRGYEIGRYTKNLASGMASVLMDRFTGFVMLVIMAIVSFLFYAQVGSDIRITAAILFSVICLLGVLWLILDRRLINRLSQMGQIPLLSAIIPKIMKVHANLYAFKSQKTALSLALFYSMIFMVLAIANVYMSAKAFHSDPIPMLKIAVIVPIIMVVAMIPLSLNGIGLEEWAYVLLFSWLGLPPAVGLSTVLLIRGKSILLALVGGLIYPIYKTTSGDNSLTNPGIDHRGQL